MSNQLTNAVSVSNGKVTTTSVKIAEVFGKEHFHVIRDIEKLQIPAEWHKSNFGVMQIDRKIGNGAVRKDKAYLITRDGFTLLAMGFTGAKAMQFKIAYIEAFNAMEAKLREQQTVPVQPELPLSEPSQPSDLSALLKMKYNGVPVIPTPDLATAFGITGQQLCKLKYDHNIFVDGLDIFRVKGVTYALTHRMIRAGYQTPLNVKSINLWTESGIRKLIPILNASYIPHKQLTCSAPVPAKAPAASLIPGLTLRKPETTEKVYHFQLENLLKLEGLPKLRELLDALDHAGYDVSDQQAELSFIENIGYRMAKWQNHVEQYLSVSLDNFRIFGNSRYVSKVKFRNGRFSSSESHFDSDVPKMEVPV